MSGLVDLAVDVFVCSSIFVDDAAQVDKLLHPVQVFVLECDGVFIRITSVFLVLILRPVSQLLRRGGTASPVRPGVCGRGG